MRELIPAKLRGKPKEVLRKLSPGKPHDDASHQKSPRPTFEEGGEVVAEKLNQGLNAVSRVVELPANLRERKGRKTAGPVRFVCWACILFPGFWPIWFILLATSARKDEER